MMTQNHSTRDKGYKTVSKSSFSPLSFEFCSDPGPIDKNIYMFTEEATQMDQSKLEAFQQRMFTDLNAGMSLLTIQLA